MAGRPSRGEEYWWKAISRQRRSGMSVAAFCREEGLAMATFRLWRKRLERMSGRGAMSDDAPRFAQLLLEPDQVKPGMVVEVELPDATRVKLSGDLSSETLTALLRGLRAPSC